MELHTHKILSELKKAGRTQAWLARKINAKPQWINEILRLKPKGSRTFNTVEKLATALGVNPKDLIK